MDCRGAGASEIWGYRCRGRLEGPWLAGPLRGDGARGAGGRPWARPGRTAPGPGRDVAGPPRGEAEPAAAPGGSAAGRGAAPEDGASGGR